MITAIAVLSTALAIGSLVLVLLPRTIPPPDSYGLPWVGPIYTVCLAVVGAAILLRQSRNTVGWIFLIAGLAGGIKGVADEYAAYAIIERGGALAGGDWAAWLGAWSLAFFVGPLSSYLFLVFPDGRLPSPRWRPVAWYTLGALVLWAVVAAALPGPLTQLGFGRNPLWPATARSPLDRASLLPITAVLLVPATGLCATALAQRFRRSRGVERQQLKWMVYAALVVAIGIALLPATPGNKPLQVAQMTTVLLIPVAAGIAILRHRLYDVDLLITRTLVYGLLSAILAAVYFVAVVLSQTLLRPFTGGSEVSVAVSTLVVVALFQPLRRRVQNAVNHRFYRSRYDAARTLDRFSLRLRDEVDLDAVRTELVSAVRETVEPAHASVWLRQP